MPEFTGGLRRRAAGLSLLSSVALLWPLSGGIASAQEQSVASSNARQEGEAPNLPAQSAQDGREAQPGIADIVVTGSRISASGFTTPTPVSVVGADRIAQFGGTSIGAVLNEMPAFRPQVTPATQQIFAFNLGANTLDLRGLGATRTLVLIGGKRVVPSTTNGTVDVNLIPASMISRADVVTGGASAAYGSDAVAGVVNLILDDSIEGVRAQVQQGISEEGDGRELQLSLMGGTKFADGRGHITLAAEYVDNRGLGDCQTRDWCAENYAYAANPAPAVNGQARTILINDAKASTMTPGGLITAGPLRGTQFLADGTPAPFIYGSYAGSQYMSGGSGGPNPFYTRVRLIAPVERYSLFGHANYELSDAIKASFDLSFARVKSSLIGANGRDQGTITIQRDNPYIPVQTQSAMDVAGITSFAFGRLGNDLGNVIVNAKRDTFRVAGGLEGNLAGSWKWDTYVQYGRANYTQIGQNARINDNFFRATDAVLSNGQIVCRSATLAAGATGYDPNCRPLNLFGENQYSPEAKAYVFSQSYQKTVTTQLVGAANVSGNLISLGDGRVSLATGIEARRDKVDGAVDPVSLANRFFVGGGQLIQGKVDVVEGYGEVAAPLLRDRPLVHALEFNGAVRYTHYSSSGGVVTWKAGGIYEPVDGVRLRTTRSRDIRAANINELYGSSLPSFSVLRDPFLGSQGLAANVVSSSPTLKPEVAKTTTIGVVLSPEMNWTRGLRLSVDYYDIKLGGAISTLPAQIIVDNCFAGSAAACGLISRDPTTNRITQVSTPYSNLAQIHTSGIDFEVDYRLSLDRISSRMGGLVNFNLLATYVDKLVTDDGVRQIDRAGQTGFPVSTLSGVPHWTLNGTVGYSGKAFGVNLQGRYIGSGVYDARLIGPGQDGYAPSLLNSISDNHVPARVYVTLAANAKFEAGSGISGEFFAVVTNLTNVDPPIAPTSISTTNPALFDMVGRAYRLGMRVRL